MNEFMQALEAMIRRIAQEEVKSAPVVVDNRDFRTGFKSYTDNNKAEWAAIVSQGCLDFPWFDDAIASEVATNTPPASGFTIADKNQFDRLVVEVIRNSESLNDRIASLVNDYSSDLSNETIREVVQNMNFSISCDVDVS